MKTDEYCWKGAPPALLALCALLLSVSDWELNAAIDKFARILAAPEPTDLLLGNVIGLNPSQDYAAWQFVVLAQEVAQQPTGVRLYGNELMMKAKVARPDACLAFYPARQMNSRLINMHPKDWPITTKFHPEIPAIPQIKPILGDWKRDPHPIVRSRKTT